MTKFISEKQKGEGNYAKIKRNSWGGATYSLGFEVAQKSESCGGALMSLRHPELDSGSINVYLSRKGKALREEWIESGSESGMTKMFSEKYILPYLKGAPYC